MAVSLSKGGNVSLSKAAPGLTKIRVGLGWDPRVTDGSQFDLDASVFAVNADGKCKDDKAFIFYNNKTSEDGAIVHQGDNRTGQGDGDDESVVIDLTKLAEGVSKAVFAVTIDQADERKQNFGQVSKAFIRVVNEADGTELARFDLSEDSSTETAMIFGEVYRNASDAKDFKFKAIGQGFQGGLAALCGAHGISAS